MVNKDIYDVTVCPLSEEHLLDVSEIEKLCFSEPWSEKSLRILLEKNAIGVSVIFEGKVVAYGGMTTVLDEGSVTNIAVHPDHRRKGFGKIVVDTLIKIAKSQEIHTVFLEVRESNVIARGLYSSMGFEECGVRKNFYKNPVESAIQMRSDI